MSIKGNTTYSIPTYCENLENPCNDPACAPYYVCETPPSHDVNSFRNSVDYNRFSSYNQAIVSKVKYNGGKTRNDYNPILNANMKTIHLPVIEVNGDTSGVVIGVPSTIDGVVSYSIFYQNNQNVQRDAFGYYSGEISFDLFEGNTSYTAIFNPGSETITDTLIGGPRWVNNCSTCRMVVPTWECIEAQISYFEQRCTGWCKFRCKVSDTFLFGSCTGGAYLGAAVLCARTKNAIVM